MIIIVEMKSHCSMHGDINMFLFIFKLIKINLIVNDRHKTIEFEWVENVFGCWGCRAYFPFVHNFLFVIVTHAI